MATIRRTFQVPATPSSVWEVFRDIGAVHTRLAPGFVVDTTVLDGGASRQVAFANGVTVTEHIVTLDDDARRLAYAITGGTASHHNASFEVVRDGDDAIVVWTTDVLPAEAADRFAQMMDAGIEVMTRALSAGDRRAHTRS